MSALHTVENRPVSSEEGNVRWPGGECEARQLTCERKLSSDQMWNNWRVRERETFHVVNLFLGEKHENLGILCICSNNMLKMSLNLWNITWIIFFQLLNHVFELSHKWKVKFNISIFITYLLFIGLLSLSVVVKLSMQHWQFIVFMTLL